MGKGRREGMRESCPHCPSVVVFGCIHLKSSRGCPSSPEEVRACRGDGGAKPEKRSF